MEQTVENVPTTNEDEEGGLSEGKWSGSRLPRFVRRILLFCLHLLFWTAVGVFALFAIVVLALQIPITQRLVANKLSRLVSDDSLTINVRRIRITPALGVDIRELLVLDLNHDTLLYAARAQTSLSRIAEKGKVVELGQTVVKGLKFSLLYNREGRLNLTDVLHYAFPPKRKKKPKAKAFRLDIQRISVVDGTFGLHKAGQSVTTGRINFGDLKLQSLNVDIRHFRSVRDTVQMDIKELSCHDHSGYIVESFASRFRVCSHSMHFSNLSTSNSATNLSIPSLRMEYASWKSLGHFIDSVRIESSIDTSTISTATLAYFMPLKVTNELVADISGLFRGSVSDFRLRDFDVRIHDKTHLRIDGYVAGLPNIQNLIANVDIQTFETDTQSAMQVANAFSSKPIRPPDMMKRINSVHFNGVLTGFFGDFVAYGQLNTNVGSVQMDMGVSLKDQGVTDFNGKINTVGLQLGKILNNPSLGQVDLTAQTKGTYAPHRGGVYAQVNSNIGRFDFRNHSYRNVSIEGFVSPRGYRGKVEAYDSIVQLQFDGNVDFSDSVPVFQFDLQVPHADLVAMGLLPPDSTATVAFSMRSYFHGNRLDNAQGEVMIRDFCYRHSHGTLQMNRIALVAENSTNNGAEIRFDSPALQAKLWGRYRFDAIPASMARLARLHIGAVVSDSLAHADSAYSADLQAPYNPGYTLLVRVNDINPVLQVFYPRLQLSRGSVLQAEYDPKSQQLSAHLSVSEASYGNVKASGASLQIARKDSIFSVDLDAPSVMVGATQVDSTTLALKFGDSKAKVDLHAATPMLGHSAADIHVNAQLRPQSENNPPSLLLRPSNTSFTISDQLWRMSSAIVVLDTTKAEVRNFRLYNGRNSLSVDGLFSANATDTVTVGIDNIDLSLLSGLLPPERTLAGNAKGNIRIGSILDTVGIATSCTIEDLMLGGAFVGTLTMDGKWQQLDSVLRVRLNNRSYDGREDIALQLNYVPSAHLFDGELRLNSWDFSLLRSLTLGAVQSRGGRLNGHVRFSGTPKEPSFDGTLRFDKAKVFVQMLGMTFSSSSAIKLQGRKVLFNSFSVSDLESHPLSLDGYVNLDTLRNPYVALRASTDRFRLLNTTARDNPMYHGNLIATTQANIDGRLNDLELRLRAKTEPGTELVFQLPQQSTAKENKYLEFALSPEDSVSLAAKREEQNEAMVSKSKLGLNLQLEITPAALFNIIIDPSTGGGISAHGEGNLQMIIPKGKGPMLLYGEYSISRGEYNFVLGSVLTKKFSIENGSYIQFNGSPTEAKLDVKTVHRVRTSLDKLVMSDEERYKRRVDVECRIHITGSAQNPLLSFDVVVPQADAEMQGLLATALNTDEKKMKQFASLLALGMFFPDSRSSSTTVSTAGGTQMGNLMISSLSDLVFSQINSWLSSGSGLSIGLGVNYNMADETNEKLQDETEVSFSMQLDELGLNVDANWDVSKNNTSSAVAGDVSVSKQSKYIKNLQYKAFARSNDDLVFSDLSPYTAGVGVAYSDSFDSLRDLWERLKSAFHRKPKKKVEVEGQDSNAGLDLTQKDDTNDRNVQDSLQVNR